ncbi:hypothetical protein KCTC52924_00940 [Arenibacter antarcticus]
MLEDGFRLGKLSAKLGKLLGNGFLTKKDVENLLKELNTVHKVSFDCIIAEKPKWLGKH